MKNIYIILILTPAFCFAQNWNPFPFDQETYFKINDEKIVMHYNDSITILGNTNILFLGATFYDFPFDNCYDDFVNQFGENPMEVIFKTNNHIYWKQDSLKLKFFPFVNPGATWNVPTPHLFNFSHIQFSCDSIKLDSVFNVLDSIKYYSAQFYNDTTPGPDTYSFILSKNYGFIKYYPMNKILLDSSFKEEFSLAGFISNGEHGFTRSFENFFHGIEIGDCYKYRVIDKAYNGIFNGRYIDSIISITMLSDTLRYKVRRKGNGWLFIYDPIVDGKVQNPITINETVDIFYRKQKFKRNTFCLGWPYFDDSFGGYGSLDSCFHNSFGWQVSFSYYPNIKKFENGFNCDTYLAGHGYHFTKYGVGLGITHDESQFSSGADDTEYRLKRLLGYKKNGIIVGDMSPIPPVVISTLSPEIPLLEISPNPSSDFIYINNKNYSSLEIEFYNINGQLLHQSKKNSSNIKIDVANFPNGLYFIRANDGENIFQNRFIKI